MNNILNYKLYDESEVTALLVVLDEEIEYTVIDTINDGKILHIGLTDENDRDGIITKVENWLGELPLEDFFLDIETKRIFDTKKELREKFETLMNNMTLDAHRELSLLEIQNSLLELNAKLYELEEKIYPTIRL